MVEKLVRTLLLTFFFCKMTKILNFLTNMLVKNKKICYNEIKIKNKGEKRHAKKSSKRASGSRWSESN